MKPITLQWTKRPGFFLIAETPVISYEIMQGPDFFEDDFVVFAIKEVTTAYDIDFAKKLVAVDVQSIEAAKGAAQAHFDAAIMACLE